MTFKPGWHIYFASGFFNDTQRELCDFIELLETDHLPIYSPRKDGFVLEPHATIEERHEVFTENIKAISVANMMLAVIDDFDTGVIWEMGYGYAANIPILAYSDVAGRGLNVMLAGSCKLGFINDRRELNRLFTEMDNYGQDDMDPVAFAEFPCNTWAGEIQ